jgi:hypothetical protein
MKPPKGFINVPNSTSWHSAIVFYNSTAFGDSPVWVERHRLTVKPGEVWQEAFKRQFGIRPEPRETAFVPAGMYAKSKG